MENPRLAPADAGNPGEAPVVSLLSQSYQHLTAQRYDQMEPALEMVRCDLVALGLPLRFIEVEYAKQMRIRLPTNLGLEPAYTMVLLRSAVKQVCHRNGYHVTFRCRRRIPNGTLSGWRLHQSLLAHDGENALRTSEADGLSTAWQAVRRAA